MKEEFTKKEAFDAFVEEYKELPLNEKKDTLIKELKEMVALVEKLCIDNNIEYDMMINREILDINKENYTEDDYVEAVYVYIQMFKEILATYFMSNSNKTSE